MGEITALLKKYGIHAEKGLSQNFLTDGFVINKIVKAAELDIDTTVIEIGSGLGSLTKELLAVSGKVVAIEVDRRLCEILNIEYACDKLEVINADILKIDLNPLISREIEHGKSVRVCANLPYHITTPVIMRLLEKTEGLKSLTLMMQKEVADRILAAPGTKEYGAITPAISFYADASHVANVPPNCFIPKPGVHSAVVNLILLDKKRVSPKDEELMFSVIKAAFGQRRKTLINALSNQLAGKYTMDKNELVECFSNEAVKALGLEPSVRGERLGLREFAALSDSIFEKKGHITEM